MKVIDLKMGCPVIVLRYDDGFVDIQRLKEGNIVDKRDNQLKHAKFISPEVIGTYAYMIIRAFDNNNDEVKFRAFPCDYSKYQMVIDFLKEKKLGITMTDTQIERLPSDKSQCHNCGVCLKCGKEFKKPKMKYDKKTCPICGSLNIKHTQFKNGIKCPKCESTEFHKMDVQYCYTIMQRTPAIFR